MLREKGWKEYWYRIVSSAIDSDGTKSNHSNANGCGTWRLSGKETKSNDSSFPSKIWGDTPCSFQRHPSWKDLAINALKRMTCLKNAGMVALPTPKQSKTSSICSVSVRHMRAITFFTGTCLTSIPYSSCVSKHANLSARDVLLFSVRCVCSMKSWSIIHPFLASSVFGGSQIPRNIKASPLRREPAPADLMNTMRYCGCYLMYSCWNEAQIHHAKIQPTSMWFWCLTCTTELHIVVSRHSKLLTASYNSEYTLNIYIIIYICAERSENSQQTAFDAAGGFIGSTLTTDFRWKPLWPWRNST